MMPSGSGSIRRAVETMNPAIIRDQRPAGPRRRRRPEPKRNGMPTRAGARLRAPKMSGSEGRGRTRVRKTEATIATASQRLARPFALRQIQSATSQAPGRSDQPTPPRPWRPSCPAGGGRRSGAGLDPVEEELLDRFPLGGKRRPQGLWHDVGGR